MFNSKIYANKGKNAFSISKFIQKKVKNTFLGKFFEKQIFKFEKYICKKTSKLIFQKQHVKKAEMQKKGRGVCIVSDGIA